MKKIFFLLLTIVTLTGFQSCSKDDSRGGAGIPQPLYIYFLINKNSEEYQDLVKAFDKRDYTEQPREKRGYNNIYFLKDNHKEKIKGGLAGYGLEKINDHDMNILLYEQLKIEKDYAYFVVGYGWGHKMLTGEEESLSLIYDDKEIPLKIKGNYITGGPNKWAGPRAVIDEFYVKNKKHKILRKEQQTYNCVLYLVE